MNGSGLCRIETMRCRSKSLISLLFRTSVVLLASDPAHAYSAVLTLKRLLGHFQPVHPIFFIYEEEDLPLLGTPGLFLAICDQRWAEQCRSGATRDELVIQFDKAEVLSLPESLHGRGDRWAELLEQQLGDIMRSRAQPSRLLDLILKLEEAPE